MNDSWNYADPPQLLLFKQAQQYYNIATDFGMASQPAPNPLDAELILWRKITNYTAFMAGRIS